MKFLKRNLASVFILTFLFGGVVFAAITGNATLDENNALRLLETTTPTAEGDVGKFYTKSNHMPYFQNGVGVEKELVLASTNYAEMFIYENAVDTVINEGGAYLFIQGLFSGDHLDGWTFDSGSTGAITAWADAGGGDVTATSAGHTLAIGDQVNIDDTTNYNGTFLVTAVNGNDFSITDTWVADDGQGNFTQPDALIAGATADGTYKFSWSTSLTSSGNNKTYKFELVKNTTHIDESASERKIATGVDIGSMASSGIFSIVAGDRIGIQVKNISDATNIMLKHANVTLNRI